MNKEKKKLKGQRGVFQNRSPLFKNLFVCLAVGCILTGLIGSPWRARDILSGAGPWILIFTFGAAYIVFIIPEILMGIALINKKKSFVISSVVVNIIYLFIFGGLFERPLVYDDEGGVKYHYAFSWRFQSLIYLIISVVLGVGLLILINHLKWSLRINIFALYVTVIIGCGMIAEVKVLTDEQRHSTLVMMRKQYVKKRSSYENDRLSELSSDVVGIKTAKFAVIPTSKITLESTSVCGNNSDLQDNVVLIEINGKPISNDDYDYLIGQEDENEPFSKRQELAAKYGLTMRKHEKSHPLVKQIKKMEIHWTEKQIDKYQGISG